MLWYTIHTFLIKWKLESFLHYIKVGINRKQTRTIIVLLPWLQPCWNFERIICNRIENSDILNISKLQWGFQKRMGCMMTSFMLKEAVYYARERKSKLYVCFLDVRKAFDRVWRAIYKAESSRCKHWNYKGDNEHVYRNDKICVTRML